MTAPPEPAKGKPLLFPSRARAPVVPATAGVRPWRVLIADDEPDVHSVTRLLLKDFVFAGRPLEFLGAWSAAEARAIMRDQPEIAVLLLDVVMESDHAGLDVVRHIRQELGNGEVRIVLRTGQPGYAPEKQVVEDFDINDYREKTELTAQKLHTVMMSALRAYRDIRTLELNRRGLERIIGASGTLFEHQSLARFATGALTQIALLLSHDQGGLPGNGSGPLIVSGFAASRHPGALDVLAGIGDFSDWRGPRAEATLPERARARLAEAGASQVPAIGPREYLGSFRTTTGSEQLVYVESPQPFEEIDLRLLQVFSATLGFAFDNVCLNRELAETSTEIVQTLSDVVETRSVDTSRHTARVGKSAHLLGRKLGLSESRLEVLRLVAPMHDLGKVGIPDALLNKPGKLTTEEYACVKAHTTIGYNILKGSKRRLLSTAAQVCLQHHERWDGTGYPHGLRGAEIDILGRIVGLVDVFDAVSNDRPYKRRWPADQVLEYIQGERGRQFDPELVDLFISHFEEFVILEREEPDGE
ncbi:MAG: DUF3369 domain-containing protein [Rhodospirillaceae bacterium]